MIGIVREVSKRKPRDGRIKRLYKALIGHGEAVLALAIDAAKHLGKIASGDSTCIGLTKGRGNKRDRYKAAALPKKVVPAIVHFRRSTTAHRALACG